ncbi:MAG TPA: hypothetical protein VK614_15070 [Allosphingosinicella sp.]|nr:hypothetical protein [Allosphingosinicella sp.]
MKTIAIYLGGALALAGCTMASDEDRMENAIRAELSKNGTVNQVEMTRQGDNMTGFAEVRANDGSEGRLNCTATRDAAKAGSYNWRCLPAIDQRMVDNMEGTIRQSLAQQGEVREVELARQDDMRMTGHAVVRGGDGEEVRANCTVTRENEASNHFDWRCAPADASAATPAEAEDGDK